MNPLVPSHPPCLACQGFRGADLDALLKKVPVKLGGGALTVPLSDLLPAACARDFERACEDWARNN